jgi:hypothetical protein
MRECRTSGSVRGVPSNGHPYRNRLDTSPERGRFSLVQLCRHQGGETTRGKQREANPALAKLRGSGVKRPETGEDKQARRDWRH